MSSPVTHMSEAGALIVNESLEKIYQTLSKTETQPDTDSPDSTEHLTCTLPEAAKPGSSGRRVKLGSTMAIFRVGPTGPDQRNIYIHANLLFQQNEILQSFLLSHGWGTKEEHMIKLERESADAVELYKDWLYNHEICTEQTDDSDSSSSSSRRDIFLILTDAYRFGASLQDVGFQDAVMTALISLLRAKRSPTIGFPAAVYARSSAGSPLRTLVIDYYAFFGCDEWISTCGDQDCPRLFLLDLSLALFQMRSPALRFARPPFWKGEPTCTYHHHQKEHTDGNGAVQVEEKGVVVEAPVQTVELGDVKHGDKGHVESGGAACPTPESARDQTAETALV